MSGDSAAWVISSTDSVWRRRRTACGRRSSSSAGDYQGIGLREADGQTRKLLAPRSELSGPAWRPAIGLLVPEKIASGAIAHDAEELANDERLARGTNGFLDFVA